MDFKNLLQSIDNISESDSKVHKGTYGTSHGKEDVRDQYGHRIGKIDKDKDSKKEQPKKGRGRPKKGSDESGEVKKYDTKSLHGVFGGGEKPKKEIGKTSKKHSLKEYIEEAEANSQLNEGERLIDLDREYGAPAPKRKASSYSGSSGSSSSYRHPEETDFMDPIERRLRKEEERIRQAYAADKAKKGVKEAEQITIQPAQASTQVIKQGNKTLGTVNNPQLAATIKSAIGKGQMTLANPNTQELGELDDNTLKSYVNKSADDIASRSNNTGFRTGARVATTAFAGGDNKIRPGEHDPKIFNRKVGINRALNRLEEEDVEESGLQAYLGNKKYGKEGMDALRKAGREHASKEKMANIRAKYDKMDEERIDSPIGHPNAKSIYYPDSKKKPVQKFERPTSRFDKLSTGGLGSGYAQDQNSRPDWMDPNPSEVKEVAPPGAKAERMVKHIKKSYAKDGKLTPKEKSIAYATAWKAHNAGKVEESMNQDKEVLTEDQKEQMINFFHELENGPKGYNIKAAIELNDRRLASSIIDKTLQHGIFKRMAGTYKGQLKDAALEHFGFTNYEESLEEGDILPSQSDSIRKHTQHALAEPTSAFSKPVEKPTPWSIDPIAAATDRASNFLSSLGKGTKFTKESVEDMKDITVEGWEKQLNSLLTEGITVSSSQGQQGSPDSVSVTATDSDAESLLSVLRNAGIGGFGAEKAAPEIGYGVAQGGEEEPTGTGTEPQPSPDVVGDGDDMLALIKKMTGIGSDAEVVAVDGGDEEGQDYEDEEGQDQTLEPTQDDGEEDSKDSDEEKTDEGNAFTGKLHDTQKGDKFKMGDKTYTDKSSIEEDDVEEGNKFTGNLAKARAEGKKEADLDGDGDMEKVREGEDTCNECGMYESQCGCDHESVEESFSNDVGGDAMGDTELMKLKELLSMGNDLHKMKHSQAVGNPTKVTMETQLMNDSTNLLSDWQKLSGIK